jgi:hypothetical protein
MTKDEQRNFAIEVAEGFAQIAVAFRNAQRSEVPLAVHLVRFRGGEPEVVALDSDKLAGMDKETMALSIRLSVQLLGAEYVIFVNEAWASFSETPEEYEAMEQWTATGKSLETFPGRQEILMVSLDGPDVALVLSADINQDGSAGPLQRMDTTVTGRLANLSGSKENNDPVVWN